MSRFSNSLAAALAKLGMTQTQFATRCGLPLSQVNRYVRGNAAVGVGNLETVVRQLPEAERCQVVAAWLRDAIPRSANGLLTILTPGATAEREGDPILSGELAAELDRSVRYLIHEARQHTEISDLLIDLARALRGEP